MMMLNFRQEYSVHYIMSDSEGEGFREAHSQTVIIKPNHAKSIEKQSKRDTPSITIKNTLTLHNDLPLFQYPRDVKCNVKAAPTCKQPLEIIRMIEGIPCQLLSDFFPRKFICVYNRFHENLTLKHDLTIIIRNISRCIRNEQLTTFLMNSSTLAQGNDHSFTSNFEGGNLHWVFKDKKSKVYYLLLQNDINTHGYNQWFHFGITPRHPGKYQFVIANLSREVRFGGEMAILTYQMATGKYQRKVSFTCVESKLRKCDRELNYWSLHFQYEFEDTGQVFFSLAAPYSHSKAMRMIKEIVQNTEDHISVKLEQAAKSELGNAIMCLKISKRVKAAKKQVIITARQHPSESVGSFVCESIISILISNHPLSLELLQHFTFIILPMINPDGVVHGNSRTNVMGYDMNRCWNRNGVIYSKQCEQIWQYLSRVCQQQHVHWSLDLHGHSRELGYFAYFSERNDLSLIMDSQLRRSNLYQADKSRFQLHHRVKQSIRGQLHQRMKITNAVTIQTSLFGVRNQQGQFIHFDGNHFKQIGENILSSLLETEKIVLDNKVKQSVLATMMQVIPLKDNCEDRIKQKELDSDSNPQQDYLRDQQRNQNNFSLVTEKRLFVRRFKTQQSTSKQKISTPPSLNFHVVPSPSPIAIQKQFPLQKKAKHMMNSSLRLLSKTNKTDKSQLFNLTFFANRSKALPSKMEKINERNRVRSERRVYSEIGKDRKTIKDEKQFSQSQHLKQSLDMRRCVRLAFSNRLRNESNQPREGNDLQTIIYPTQNSCSLINNRQNLQLRKNQMKELRSQQYGVLMINSLSKAFQMRFTKRQSGKSR